MGKLPVTVLNKRQIDLSSKRNTSFSEYRAARAFHDGPGQIECQRRILDNRALKRFYLRLDVNQPTGHCCASTMQYKFHVEARQVY